MISFELGVEDLADTRFAVSPLHEAVLSLRVLRDPGLSALHLPWRRSVLGKLGSLDTDLLLSLVGDSHALPDFLTPPPTGFAPLLRRGAGRRRPDLPRARAPRSAGRARPGAAARSPARRRGRR